MKRSPNLKEGYVRIANDLLDAIAAYPFSAGELKVILYIIRRTYGWNRKKALMTPRSIAITVDLDTRYVKRLIKKLISDKIILKEQVSQTTILGLNKRYPQWRLWITLKRVAQEPLEVNLQDTKNSGARDTHIKTVKTIIKNSRKPTTTKTIKRNKSIPEHIKNLLGKWVK
ncbi:MAG: replication protein [Candidatus Omnitrophota bacterium]